MKANGQDPAAEDLGNIQLLEHVNVTQPDQRAATIFYLMGLGLTRDPYMNVGISNMWVNAGEQQFHLPTRPAQVIPGNIGLVMPNLDALRERLTGVKEHLKDTRFAWSDAGDHVEATCPWGNQFQCWEPSERFGRFVLGMPYVEFMVKPGAAAGIARFYQAVMGAPSRVEECDEGMAAIVSAGRDQSLVFQETDRELPEYDGHHIAVYVADFSGPYAFLEKRNLVTEGVRNHQIRFVDIVHPETGEVLHKLEHEVRSLAHPMFKRPMVNRNPAQSQMGYAPGRDVFGPVVSA